MSIVNLQNVPTLAIFLNGKWNDKWNSQLFISYKLLVILKVPFDDYEYFNYPLLTCKKYMTFNTRK